MHATHALFSGVALEPVYASQTDGVLPARPASRHFRNSSSCAGVHAPVCASGICHLSTNPDSSFGQHASVQPVLGGVGGLSGGGGVGGLLGGGAVDPASRVEGVWPVG